MKNMNVKKLIAIVSFSLLIILLFLLKSKFSENTLPEVKTGKKALEVSYLIAANSPLTNSIKINGSVLANEEVELRSQISGKITSINFTEGEIVKKGKLLVKINDLELQAQKAKIEVKLALARDREFRQKKLLEKSLASQQEYDIILNELNSQAADLQLINAQIEKTEIIAPFDGIVGLRSVSVGSYVTPDKKIATIQNYDKIKIDFNVPQKYALYIEKGGKIKFSIPNTDNIFSATIYAVEPKIDQNSRTLQVRAALPYNHKLLSGSYVEIELPIKGGSSSIFIPSQAIVPDISGQLVFKYQNGIVKQVNIQTGLRTEDAVEIVDGVSIGDTIISSGLLLMKDGIKVQLK